VIPGGPDVLGKALEDNSDAKFWQGDGATQRRETSTVGVGTVLGNGVASAVDTTSGD
jgi:hypothetical protein